MADSILAIPLSTGGLGDGGWVAVAAFSLNTSSYSISSSTYDIGCIVSGTRGNAIIITPFYFLSVSSEKNVTVPYRDSDGTAHATTMLYVTPTYIQTLSNVSASIILFKST